MNYERETITTFDENGLEVEYKIMFTIADEVVGKRYVVYTDDTEVFASTYVGDYSTLIPVESDNEWEMLNDIIASYKKKDTKF